MLQHLIEWPRPERTALHLREEAGVRQELALAAVDGEQRQSEWAENIAFNLRQAGADIPTAADVFARHDRRARHIRIGRIGKRPRVPLNTKIGL